MKSLVRIGAIARLNLLCCSSFAQAADVTNNIKLKSNLSQQNVLNKTLPQEITLDYLKIRLQPTGANTEFAKKECVFK